jgi:hypothetical protein
MSNLRAEVLRENLGMRKILQKSGFMLDESMSDSMPAVLHLEGEATG